MTRYPILKVSVPVDTIWNSALVRVLILRTIVSPKPGCTEEGNPHSNRSFTMETALFPKLGVHLLLRAVTGEAEVPARMERKGRTKIKTEDFMVV